MTEASIVRRVGIGYKIAVYVSVAIWLLPIFAVLTTSIRSLDDLVQGNFWGWPGEIHLLENYSGVLSDPKMARFLLNSFVIAIPAVIGAVALACMAGFALAKFRFPGNTIMLALFVGGNLVPFQAMMIPLRELIIALGIYDTRFALIVFHIAFQTGFCTLFMRNFIKQIPDSFLDSARTEGTSEARIFWHVVLPLVRPAIAAVSALTFTFIWNDYFWSLVLVHSDEVRPLTAGLNSLQGMWLASWNLYSAASIVAAIPPVTVFLIMQQHLIAGLTGTASDE